MFLLLAILLGIIPGFVWLVFFLQEDPKPEPKRLIAYVFLAGTIVVFPAILLEQGYGCLFEKSIGVGTVGCIENLVGIQGGKLIFFLIGLALIEEVLKFAAAYFVIHKSTFFDEAIDAMIYMIIAGLGFATAENILFAFGVFKEGLAAGLIQASVIGGVFETVALRFVGATLLHGLGSGLIGYYWARGIVQGKERHFIWAGLFAATALHALFNYFIIIFVEVQIIYPSILLIIAAIFVLYDFEKIKGYPRIIKSETQDTKSKT